MMRFLLATMVMIGCACGGKEEEQTKKKEPNYTRDEKRASVVEIGKLSDTGKLIYVLTVDGKEYICVSGSYAVAITPHIRTNEKSE